MTTAIPMLAWRCALVLIVIGSLGACTPKPPALPLTPPVTLKSPYSSRDVIWAVLPLANESGTSVPNELTVTDALVNSIREVDGLTALPTNRVIQAMRTLGMPGISSPQEAQALAGAVGADGILVGTITAWDPYHPPQLGVSVALFARTNKMLVKELSQIDPLELRQAMTDAGITVGEARDLPVAVVANHYDAANHTVLLDVKQYATGRHDPRSALGWEYYTQSMGRYTEFVCFSVLKVLLEQEERRVLSAEAQDK